MPQEVAQLPQPAAHGVPLAPGGGKCKCSSSSSSAFGSSSSSSTRRLPLDVAPLDASTLTLPEHLVREATELQQKASTDNPVTEVQARPLIRSTAIWLMKQGVVNKEDSPGVIQRAGELLHHFIPLHFCHVPKAKTSATDFPTRIFAFLQNHVTRSGADFVLQVPHDATLNTPMRALEHHGYLERLPEGEIPPAGHSGGSIIGKRKSFFPTPLDSHHPDRTSTPFAMPANVSAPAPHVPNVGVPAVPDNPHTVSSMLTALARSAGLDVTIAAPGRSAETSKLPLPDAGGRSEAGEDSDAGERSNAKGKRKAPASTVPTVPEPDASASRKRTHQKAKKAKPPSSCTAPPLPDLADFPFTASVRYEAVQPEGDIAVGDSLAYFMSLPEAMGGDEWYIGEVLRVSRGVWTEVQFSDGKLWLRTQASERGSRWAKLA